MAPPSPTNVNAVVKYITEERRDVVQNLAQVSKRLGAPSDASSTKTKVWYNRLDVLLDWLEHHVRMSPTVKERTQVDKTLQLMFARPEFHFPKRYTERAQALYEKWEGEAWGAPVDAVMRDVDESESEIEGEGAALATKVSRMRRQSVKGLQMEGRIIYPPQSDRFWNHEMKGIVYRVKDDGRRDLCFDDRFKARNAKLYGHNGLEAGSWWPRRLVAMFHGAHGSSQAGIVGNADTGAFSIVVSGEYEDLDRDRGDILHYSGPRANESSNPNQPSEMKTGTKALHTSRRTGKPVRVLRARGTRTKRSRFAPTTGIRYDGLYQVADVRMARDEKGKQYQQFELRRLLNQPDIDAMRPNAIERAMEGKIERGYHGARPTRA